MFRLRSRFCRRRVCLRLPIVCFIRRTDSGQTFVFHASAQFLLEPKPFFICSHCLVLFLILNLFFIILTPVTQVFLIWFFIAAKPEIVSFCENKTANCSEMKEATQFETIRLLCNFYAYPDAEVMWYVRGLNKSGPDQQIDTHQNHMWNIRNGTLVIQNLRRNDTGWFRCFANNTVGNDSAMVYLRVKGESTDRVSRSSVPLVTLSLLQRSLAHILYPVSIVLVRTRLSISCSRKPAYLWSRMQKKR